MVIKTNQNKNLTLPSKPVLVMLSPHSYSGDVIMLEKGSADSVPWDFYHTDKSHT